MSASSPQPRGRFLQGPSRGLPSHPISFPAARALLAAVVASSLVLLSSLLPGTSGFAPAAHTPTAPNPQATSTIGDLLRAPPISSSQQNSSTQAASPILQTPEDKVVANVSVGIEPGWIAYDPGNGDLYVTNHLSNNVSVISGATNKVVATVNVGPNPDGVGFDSGNGNLYVANWGVSLGSPGNVSVIAGSTNSVVASIGIGNGGPEGVAYDSGNGYLYVANEDSNNVTVISGTTNKPVASVGVGSVPRGVTYDPVNGNIYVANDGSSNVSVISGATNRVVATVAVGTNPEQVAYDPGSGDLYVANGGSNNVSAVSGATNHVVATTMVGTNPWGVGYDSAIGNLYVADSSSNNLSVISGATNKVVGSVGVGSHPLGVTYDPGNGEVYVTNYNSNNVSVISPSVVALRVSVSASPGSARVGQLVSYWANASGGIPPYHYTWRFGDGTTSSQASPTHSYGAASTYTAVAWVNDSSSSPIDSVVGSIPSARSPWAPTYDPANGRLYVPNLGTNNISVISDSTNTVIATMWARTNVSGLTLDPVNADIYAANPNGANVTVISATSNQLVASLSVGGAPIPPAYDSTNGDIYVPNQLSDNISVISGATNKVIATIPVGRIPWGAAFDRSNGDIYVPNAGSNNVSVISGATNKIISSIPVGNYPLAIALDSATGTLYVSNQASGNVTAISDMTNRAVAWIPVGSTPYAPIVDPGNGDIYVENQNSDNVSVISSSTNRVIANIAVGPHPTTLTYDAGTGEVFVPAPQSNGQGTSIGVINGATNTLALTLIVGVRPGPIAYDNRTGNLYVPNLSSNNVSVISHVLRNASAFASTVIVVNPTVGPLTATASATPLAGTAPLAVNFGSSVSGGSPPYTYLWRYGDGGGPSQFANPSHTYNLTGTYEATLNVTDSMSKLAYAHAWVNVTAALSVALRFNSPSQGYSPLTVSMDGNASGGVPSYSYSWAFGDGYTGSGQAVTHTFLAPSGCGSGGNCNYTVGVTALDSQGHSATTSGIVAIIPSSSSALLASMVFSSPTSGYAPLTVTVSGNATGGSAPYTFAWAFGDGATGSGLLVSHVYHSPSGCGSGGSCTYNLTLAVQDSGGHIASAVAPISIWPNGTRTFATNLSMTPSSGSPPLNVSFAGSASGGQMPYTFVWSFGDGATGTGATPQHTYTRLGTFSVVLTSVDGRGTVAEATSSVQVFSPPPPNGTGYLELSLDVRPATGPAPLFVHFVGHAQGGAAPYSFEWTFGDGSATGTGASVFHTFVSAGSYVTTMFANDSQGDQASTGVFITAYQNGSGGGDELRASVTMLSLRGPAPFTATFSPSVIGGLAPYQLVWSFGDGSPAVSRSGPVTVTHTYSKPGTYMPTLQVTDSGGTVTLWSAGPTDTGHPVSVSGPTAMRGSLPPLLAWAFVGVAAVLVVVSAVMVVERGRRIRKLSSVGGGEAYAAYRTRPGTGDKAKSKEATLSVEEDDALVSDML